MKGEPVAESLSVAEGRRGWAARVAVLLMLAASFLTLALLAASLVPA